MDNGHFIQAIATYSAGLEKRIATLDKTIEELQKALNAANAALAVQRDLMEELEQRLVEVEARPAIDEEPEVEVELLMDDDTEEPELVTAEVAEEEPVQETPVEAVEEPQEQLQPEPATQPEPVVAEPAQEEPKAEPAPAVAPAEPVHTDAHKANTAYGAPVTDLKQAISIGDRFLYQRELFGKNGELMQRTIADLNGLNTFDEAMEYIDRHFNWDKEQPSYELFVNALHRRFA
mgnify:CR=1 FL=1